jgi:hypothetical protein
MKYSLRLYRMVKANKTKAIRKVDFTWEWNPHLGALNENKELSVRMRSTGRELNWLELC